MMTELINMVDEMVEKKEKKKESNVVSLGLDIGTMNIVCSRSDSNNIKMTRNVFLELDPEIVNVSELTDISYVEGEEGEIFIIGEDAFKFANIFNQKVSRPMEKGLISPKEISAIDVLTLMIKDIVGDVKNKDTYCSFSIPAEAIDESRSVSYHENVFSRILGSFGVNHTSVNEAMAIIYSECAKEKFSGLAISFGAGMANVCLAFKGIEALKFSTARAGDWIDKQTAESLNIIPNRVTSLKEKHIDLSTSSGGKGRNKKDNLVLQALYHFYESLINYTIKKIIKEFEEKVDIEIDDSLPVVISGGTSLPKGFLELFKSVLNRYELPFEISEIRCAKNPLVAVSNGLLVRTMSDVKNK